MRRSLMIWVSAALGFAVACTGDSVHTGTRSDGVIVYCNIGEYYYVCTPEEDSGEKPPEDTGTLDPCGPNTYPCPTGTDDPTSDGDGDGDGGDGGGGGDGDGGGGDGDGGDGGGDGDGSNCNPDGVPCDGDGDGGGGDGDGGDACNEPWPLGTATVLWPPNHKMHTYTLADCGKAQVCPNGQSIAAGTVTRIEVDEDIDVGRGGDGHTTNFDARIIDSTHFELRSERQGGGDGRVYTVYFTDSNGDAGSCQFLVPHNRGPHEGAVDSGTKVTILP